MYDDLKRARTKLGKPYIYAGWGRSTFGFLLQQHRLDAMTVGRNFHRSWNPNRFRPEPGLSCGSYRLGQLNSLALLRNCLISRIALASRPQTLKAEDCRTGPNPSHHNHALLGDCVRTINPPHHNHDHLGDCMSTTNPPHHNHDHLGDCVRTTLLGSTLSSQSRPFIRDIAGILQESDIIEQLFQIISPKLQCCDKDGATVFPSNPGNDSAAGGSESDGSFELEGEDKYSETCDQCDDWCVDEDMLSFSFEDGCDESPEADDQQPWINDTWFGNPHATLEQSNLNWSFESKTRDSLCLYDHESTRSPWEVKSEPNIYFLTNQDFPPSSISMDDSLQYELRAQSLPSEQLDNDNELPCLNHNTSVPDFCDCVDDMFACDQFPLDEMMPLCTARNIQCFETPSDADLLGDNSLCENIDLLDNDSFMRCRQNCIDNMKDTYTLSGFPVPADKKRYPNADDGARGDGIHFNLGIPATWWCQGDGTVSNKGGFAMFPDPSPQDRLARITYKTQPSDASSADAPMFVFSSAVGTINKSTSSSRVIPLDFNLNAVYKTVPHDERGAGDTKVAPEEDASFSTIKRSPPEGSTDTNDLPRARLDEASGSETFPEPLEAECCPDKNLVNSLNADNNQVDAPSQTRVVSQPGQTLKWCITLALCVVILSALVSHYWTRESFLRLLWDLIMHTSFVGLLLLLVFICLEANNLTEIVVRKLQVLIKAPITTSRKFVHNERTVPQVERSLLNSTKLPSSKTPAGSPDIDDVIISHSIAAKPQKDDESSIEKLAEKFQNPADEKGVALCENSGMFAAKEGHNAMKSDGSDGLNASAKVASTSNNVAYFEDLDDKQKEEIKEDLASGSQGVCSSTNDEQPSIDSEKSIDITSLSTSKQIFTETSTMTDVYPDTKYNAGLGSTECSVAQTMTEFINFESSSTQTEHTIEDDSSESAFQIVEIWPEAAGVQTASVSVQAEMDARKVYQQTERLQQKHQLALKRLQKKFLAIRRRCQKEAQELKQSDRRKNEFLSKLQLSLPNLQKEKSSLMAERASIDKQFEDEKKKNRELVGRLTRLNQQFYRLGQVQQQPPPPPIHWRQQYQHQTYPPPTARPHCDPTNHLNHQKPGHPQPHLQQANIQHQQLQQKVQQQSTLLQNQVRGNNPVPPPNQPQQQNQQQQLIQQQQLLHQQRLPIFQLFNKSFCPPHHENQQLLQQPQAQQQHSQQQLLHSQQQQHPKMQQL